MVETIVGGIREERNNPKETRIHRETERNRECVDKWIQTFVNKKNALIDLKIPGVVHEDKRPILFGSNNEWGKGIWEDIYKYALGV